MNRGQALGQLLNAIESHNLAISKDDIQRAFNAGSAQEQELVTWVQECLNPDTLLSGEEEAL